MAVPVPSLGEPAWARSLTLSERLTLPGPVSADPSGPYAQRAPRRLQRWRQAHDLARTGGFAARLTGMSEDLLLALLAEPPAGLAARAGTPPPWVPALDRILTGTRPLPPGAADQIGDWRSGLGFAVGPFVADAVSQLERRLRDSQVGDGVAVATVLNDVAGTLSGALATLAGRTLVLELNVMRVQGLLSGATPAARFWSFVGHITGRAGQDALFAEYPVLARLLVQRAEQTVDAVWELLERWHHDRAAVIAEVFGGADPGVLASVAFDAGDGHQRGRAVAVLRFASGAKLVYKPRPLAVHMRFNELLHWFDEAAGGLGLRRLRVVDRGQYGWVEFAAATGCATGAEVHRYYHRMGALLALLYAVDGSDFHYENLVASGDQPVLVDLETLFHPQLSGPDTGSAALDPAQAVVSSSVMRVGVLPAVMAGPDGAMDFGGLGGDRGAVLPFATPTWDEAGTDTMHLVRQRMEFPGGHNRPTHDGVPIDPTAYAGALLAGFRQGYDAVAARRDELVRPGGLLDRFASVPVRTVVRATRVYATLLHEGTHPDLLRDALDRDRHFDFLWTRTAGETRLTRLVPYEIADLWTGDIPYFHAQPGARHVWTSGGELLADLLPERPLDRVRAKLASLGPADRERQEWFIQAALVTRPRTGGASIVETGRAVAAEPACPLDRAALLAAARRIGDRLAHLAVHDPGRTSWLGLDLVDTTAGRWTVNPLRFDLYSGFPGIALFLARLGRVTGERRYTDLAHRALWSVPEFLQECAEVPAGQRGTVYGIGGFAGLTGLAYALVHVAADGGDTGLHAFAERTVELAAPAVDTDEALDVVGGSAGAIGALLAVHASTGLPAARDLAIRCGERLLDRAVPQPGGGVVWNTPIPAVAPLTGFSHGAGGIGWALIRLGAAVDDPRFVQTGLAAFAYERGEFRPDWENWPDYRDEDGSPGTHMFAWCHGAPGIGLARAGVAAIVDSEPVREDLARAVAGTIRYGFGMNHSLCHGDLGNAELLIDVGAGDALHSVAARVLASLADGPRCGTPYAVETPGLMTGLAGIGYGLLRLADPATPAVLRFAEPDRRVGR